MKEFAVKTAFIFEGFFFVKAESEEQAKQFVTENCGLVIGSNIHSNLPDAQVDWDFCTHGETVIKKVKQLTDSRI